VGEQPIRKGLRLGGVKPTDIPLNVMDLAHRIQKWTMEAHDRGEISKEVLDAVRLDEKYKLRPELAERGARAEQGTASSTARR
jgi:hypothetical protein